MFLIERIIVFAGRRRTRDQTNRQERLPMSTTKAERKKKMTRWLALAVAGVMVVTVVLAAVLKL